MAEANEVPVNIQVCPDKTRQYAGILVGNELIAPLMSVANDEYACDPSCPGPVETQHGFWKLSWLSQECGRTATEA